MIARIRRWLQPISRSAATTTFARNPGKTKPGPRSRRALARLGLVGFHLHGFVVREIRPLDGDRFWRDVVALDPHPARGSNLADGIETAMDLMDRAAMAPRRSIHVLTDGRTNLQSHNLGDAVERVRSRNVALHALGVGPNHDREMLPSISEQTPRGQYTPLYDPRSAAHFASTCPDPFHSGTAVIVLDLSSSMAERVGALRKLDLAKEWLRLTLPGACG